MQLFAIQCSSKLTPRVHLQAVVPENSSFGPSKLEVDVQPLGTSDIQKWAYGIHCRIPFEECSLIHYWLVSCQTQAFDVQRFIWIHDHNSRFRERPPGRIRLVRFSVAEAKLPDPLSILLSWTRSPESILQVDPAKSTVSKRWTKAESIGSKERNASRKGYLYMKQSA